MVFRSRANPHITSTRPWLTLTFKGTLNSYQNRTFVNQKINMLLKNIRLRLDIIIKFKKTNKIRRCKRKEITLRFLPISIPFVNPTPIIIGRKRAGIRTMRKMTILRRVGRAKTNSKATSSTTMKLATLRMYNSKPMASFPWMMRIRSGGRGMMVRVRPKAPTLARGNSKR